MTDTLSQLRASTVVVDKTMIAAAALQYAEITIQTLIGVCTDLAIAKEAEKHEGMTDLIGAAVEIMNAARSILHGVSDGSSRHAVVAYRMLQVADGHVMEILRTTKCWSLAARRPGTLRDLESCLLDPLASVERALGRCFRLNDYISLLSRKITMKRFMEGY